MAILEGMLTLAFRGMGKKFSMTIKARSKTNEPVAIASAKTQQNVIGDAAQARPATNLRSTLVTLQKRSSRHETRGGFIEV